MTFYLSGRMVHPTGFEPAEFIEPDEIVAPVATGETAEAQSDDEPHDQ